MKQLGKWLITLFATLMLAMFAVACTEETQETPITVTLSETEYTLEAGEEYTLEATADKDDVTFKWET